MKLGIEHREQVYFLAGLIVFAGYMMYISLSAVRRPAERSVPSHPSKPQRGSKAIGRNDMKPVSGRPLPGVGL